MACLIAVLEIPAVQGSFPGFACKSVSLGRAAPALNGPSCHLSWDQSSAGRDGRWHPRTCGLMRPFPRAMLTASSLQAPGRTLLLTRSSLVLKPSERLSAYPQPEVGCPAWRSQRPASCKFSYIYIYNATIIVIIMIIIVIITCKTIGGEGCPSLYGAVYRCPYAGADQNLSPAPLSSARLILTLTAPRPVYARAICPLSYGGK